MCFESIKSLDDFVGHGILRQKAINSYYSNPSICKNCGDVIKIPCGDLVYETKIKKFCKSECAISYTKKKRIRIYKYKCLDCGSSLKKRVKRCVDCASKVLPKYNTIKDALYEKHHKASTFSYIRWQARSFLLKEREYLCEFCGYDKIVECCHIKPISDFDLNTKIEIVNDSDNLLFLCPNHHWETEHLNLKIEEIMDSEFYHKNRRRS